MERLPRLAAIIALLSMSLALPMMLADSAPALAQDAATAEPGALPPAEAPPAEAPPAEAPPAEAPLAEPQTTSGFKGPTITRSDVPGAANCSGVTCLSQAEREELNALCKKAGKKWERYTLCRQMAALISNTP